MATTPVCLPREFHGQRSLAGYSPWDHKESDTTEVTTYACMHSPREVMNTYAGCSQDPIPQQYPSQKI